MEILQNIETYLALVSPSIIGIITSIASVIVAICKVKSIRNDAAQNAAATLQETRALKREVQTIVRENAELKRENRRLLKVAYGIKDDE